MELTKMKTQPTKKRKEIVKVCVFFVALFSVVLNWSFGVATISVKFGDIWGVVSMACWVLFMVWAIDVKNYFNKKT